MKRREAVEETVNNMKIVNDYPPNYQRIKARFNISGKNIAFTYGDTVYIPNGGGLVDHVRCHEAVHIEQQADIGPEAWWDKYLTDDDFRFNQELEAYQAQYQFACSNYVRQRRRLILQNISRDLSGPMYGNVTNFENAQKLIQNK